MLLSLLLSDMPPRKKRSAVRCCVIGCNNTSENSPALKMYRFPNANFHTYKKNRRDNWISFVRQTKLPGSLWLPHDASRICSQHFIGNRKTENPLNPSYNPSIFPREYHNFPAPVAFPTALSERCKKVILCKKPTMDEATCSTSREFHPQTYQTFFHQELTFDEVEGEDVIGRTADQETQVNFIDDNRMNETCHIFVCNRYIYVDLPNYHTCDVEIQTNIRDPGNCGKFIVKKFMAVNENSKIVSEDKSVGTEDRDDESSLISKMELNAISFIKNDRILDLAGVTLNSYQLLLKILPPSGKNQISKEKSLLIFLIRMKRGIGFSALSVIFAIDKSTVEKIFISTLLFLAAEMKNFVFWPNRDIVKATMPQIFRETYGDCRVIIDRMRVRVEKSPILNSRLISHSKRNEIRHLEALAGFTPSGVISFISKCHSGRNNDSRINGGDKLVELLEPGDVVLANQRFPEIEKKIDETRRGILIIRASFLHNDTIFSEKLDEPEKEVRLKIHVKRILRKLRSYRILNKFTLKMLPHCDHIVFMCCVLVNLEGTIIKKE